MYGFILGNLHLALAALIVVLALTSFHCRSVAARRVWLCLFSFACIVLFGWCSYWSWVLRDGLGPDMAVSTGRLAWRRFATSMIPVWAFLVTVGLIGYAGVRSSRRRWA